MTQLPSDYSTSYSNARDEADIPPSKPSLPSKADNTEDRRRLQHNPLKSNPHNQEVEILRSTCSSQSQELEHLSRVLKEKEEVIAFLNQRFLHYEETHNLTISELMEFKNKAIEARGFIQKYNVTKVSAVKNSPCTVSSMQIFAKKDEALTCYVEVVTKGKTLMLLGTDIEEVRMHPVNPTRFYIKAVEGAKPNKLTFECDEARQVYYCLKEFLGWERCYSAAEELQ